VTKTLKRDQRCQTGGSFHERLADGFNLRLGKVPEANGARILLKHGLDGKSRLFLQEGGYVDLGNAELDHLTDILVHCAGRSVHDKRDGGHRLVEPAAEIDVEMCCLDGHGMDGSN